MTSAALHPSPTADLPAPIQELFSASAVRSRCHEVCEYVRKGHSAWFTLSQDTLAHIADKVAAITRKNYPSLVIPYHSRWGHFAPPLPGNTEPDQSRLSQLREALQSHSALERGIRQYDLAIVSVLLDAGAGMGWRYTDAKGHLYSKSEGLAIASFDAFTRGEFSAHASDPLRVDSEKLERLSEDDLARIFQVSASNELVGVQGRTALLRRLGLTLHTLPQFEGRPGMLFRLLINDASHSSIPAPLVLAHILRWFTPMWPGRLTLGDIGLGDVWHHPAVKRSDQTDSLVPFHKLSQWLTYSLLEPLEWAGYQITDISQLTGLAEYRNGGLFIDGGVLQPRQPLGSKVWQVQDELVVEWRAVTVALLDELLPLVQKKLGVAAKDFPLAKLLQGGTWSAGRELALARSKEGAPPLRIESDGTVF